MADKAWKRGDTVRHPERPEWGVGSITKVEAASHQGKPCQRLTVRFELGGLKTLSTAFAKLRPADSGQGPSEPRSPATSSRPPGRPSNRAAPARRLDSQKSSSGEVQHGWLDDLERARPLDRLVKLPEDVTDPFATAVERLRRTLQLYRFTGVGAPLIDWAVMQTGLRDPLSEFNRHELEDHFRSFRRLLDEHVRAVAREAGQADPQAVADLMSKAPAAARSVLARRHSRR